MAGHLTVTAQVTVHYKMAAESLPEFVGKLLMAPSSAAVDDIIALTATSVMVSPPADALAPHVNLVRQPCDQLGHRWSLEYCVAGRQVFLTRVPIENDEKQVYSAIASAADKAEATELRLENERLRIRLARYKLVWNNMLTKFAGIQSAVHQAKDAGARVDRVLNEAGI